MKRPVQRKKIHLGVTLDEDLVNRLRELAEEDSRTLSNYINHILRNLILRNNNRR